MSGYSMYSQVFLDAPGQKHLGLKYLLDRGISQETIAENKVEICTNFLPSVCGDRIGFDSWNNVPLQEIVKEALWFPCRDDKGQTLSWSFRPLPALAKADADGEVKFLTPKKGNNFPFIPAPTWAVKEKPKHPLLITEGPVKGLAALQAGAFPIAFHGVWMGTISDNEATRLHPALDTFQFRGRIVYIAFDADFETNPSVRQAIIRTAVLLHKKGAEVKILTWDLSEGKGLDDYLAAKSRDGKITTEVFDSLCANAGDLGRVLRSCDLEAVKLEIVRAQLKGSLLDQFCRLVAKPLGTGAAVLRDEVSGESKEEAQNPMGISTPEPWPDPVDGSDLLGDIVALIRNHVILKETEAQAIGLWIFLTYLEDVVGVLPMLAIQSAVKRCGKTSLLSLLLRLVSKPLPVSNCSTASLYRVIEQVRPTFLIDEVDTWLRDNEEARGILNSGHGRDMAFVLRCNQDSGEPERFSTWAPKVLAGIGKQADTLADRSIIIKLERRKPTETITKLRDADQNRLNEIPRKLIRWALDNRDAISQARPKIPDALNDREGDNWFPLLAIADRLGWNTEARTAALALNSSDDTETATTLLIMKIKEAVDDLTDEMKFVSSLHLVEELNRDKTMPWSDWSKDGLTEKKLANALKNFGVKSVQLRSGESTGDGKKLQRGYMRSDLQPVFERYIPRQEPLESSSIRDGSM
jgi:Protein of unknown function (DUF3631)/Domain of unknown function (DUF3854)